MKKGIIGVALASTIIFGGGITTVHADNNPITEMNPLTENTSINIIEKSLLLNDLENVKNAKKEEIDFLYVIDKDKYKEIVSTDAVLFIIKDRLLIVDSEKLTKEDLVSIESAKEFYVIGELENELKSLVLKENFKAEILSENRIQVALNLAEQNGLDKDIVIAHANSNADSLTGIQMSQLQDMNLLLIGDEIPRNVQSFIEKTEQVNISFIEGEHKIDENIKKQILELAGNSHYEINTENFIKKTLMPKDVQDSSIAEDSVIKPKLNDIDKFPANDIKTDSLIANLNPNVKDSITNTTEKIVKENKEMLIAKEKVISLDLTNESKDLEEIVANDSVEIIKNDKEKAKGIIDEVNNDENKSAYQLTITHNEPIDKEKVKNLEQENKDYYIVPKEVNEEIVKKVMNGDFGNGQQRKENLELEGYDYNEVQKEIQVIVENKKRSSNSSSYNYSAPTYSQSGNVEAFINSLTSMQGWTYSQSKRMQNGYADCSSIILRAMLSSGVTSNSANLTTHTIGNDSRFYEIPMSQIKKGDILWKQGHTEVFMGGNTTFGAFKPGKPAGYSSGVNRFTKAYRIVGF